MASIHSYGNRRDASVEQSAELVQLMSEARKIVEQEKSLPGTVQSVQRKNLMRWLSESGPANESRSAR